MPTALDFAYLAFLFLLVTLVEGLVFFPRFKAAVAAGEPGVRSRAYRRISIAQWVFALIVVGTWVWAGRSWADLRLTPPGGWHLGAGMAIVVVIVGFSLAQSRGIARLREKPELAASYRARLAEHDFILPHSLAEYRGFVGLSVTAGVCEELLVRGYLMWALRPYMSVAAAVALSAAMFGLGHAYQGRKGILKTAAVGVVMNLIVIASGSLIPAMVVHALIDLSAGQVAYAVFSADAPLTTADLGSAAGSGANFGSPRSALPPA